jgi:hypothetical protein
MDACCGANLLTTDAWTRIGCVAVNRMHVQTARMENPLLERVG